DQLGNEDRPIRSDEHVTKTHGEERDECARQQRNVTARTGDLRVERSRARCSERDYSPRPLTEGHRRQRLHPLILEASTTSSAKYNPAGHVVVSSPSGGRVRA